jgi:hypothetical protein
MEEIIAARPPAVIVADGCAIPGIGAGGLREANDTWRCSRRRSPAANVIDLLRIYLSRQLAETVELHGVMMDVLGMGVLITGDSGVGKSELGPGTDLARPRPGGRRHRRDRPASPPTSWRALPGDAAGLPRSARPGRAQHPHHLRRDRLPAQDEAQAGR